MTQTHSALDTPSVVLAATAVGTAAVIVFAVLPVLVGVMADRYVLDDAQAGLVATSYFSAYALVALTSSAWIRRWNWRQAVYVGFFGLFAGLVLCLVAPVFPLACFALALAGAGAAVLFPISLTLVSDMMHAMRTYAVKTSAEQLIPAFLLLLLSTTLFADYGQTELLLALMVVVAACLVAARALPKAGRARSETAIGSGVGLGMSVLSLVALGVCFAGFAGLWAFFERIAVDHAFDADFTNTWLAVGLIMSGVGPLGAAVLEDRLGRVWPLTGGCLVSLACLFLLVGDVDPTAYAATLTLLPLAFYFAVTYMLDVVAAADYNGRMSGQMTFALAVGAAIGPALFGVLKTTGGNVVLGMGVLIGTGGALMIWLAHRLQAEKTITAQVGDQHNQHDMRDAT